MSIVMVSGTRGKGYRFLLSAILAIVFVLSLISMARAAETGMATPKEEMQTEQMGAPEAEVAKQAPAGETQKAMPESRESGEPAAKDASPEPAKGEAAGGGK